MKRYEQDMTQGNIWKQMLFYSIPLMFTNVLQVLYNLVDVAVVGKFGGSGALGSVGSTTILSTLFLGLFIGLAGGTNVLVALAAGEKNKKKTNEVVHTAAIFTMIAGIMVSAFGVIFAEDMLEMMNTRPELLDGAVIYFRIYFLGMPALAMYNYGNAVLSGIGDTKHPLYYLIFSGVVHIALSLIFVIGFQMNVVGAALANVISQYVSASLLLVNLMKTKGEHRLSLKQLRVVPDVAKTWLRIGVPSAIQNAMFQFASIFVQIGINSFETVIVEGAAAATNAGSIIYEMMTAFYIAGASFVGQNYGARNMKRVKKSYFVSILYAAGIAVIGSGLLIIFRTRVLGMFTADVAVKNAGAYPLIIMGCSYWISSLMDASIAASRGLGKTFVPTVIVFIGSCALRVLWIYTVFAFYGTILSLFLLYGVSWILTGIAECLYFFKIYKETATNLLSEF